MDPTRRAIFGSLACKPRAVGELAAELPVSRPAVSQDLRVLKEAGLVTDSADGPRRIYQIRQQGVQAVHGYLKEGTVMTYYMYKVTPPRPTFAADMTASEAAIMAQHVAFWTDLLDKGAAVTFGPVADPAGLYGMAVVESSSEQEVRVLASGDPVVCTGLFTYEVFTMPQAIARPAQSVRLFG